jgi:hypothetical protein
MWRRGLQPGILPSIGYVAALVFTLRSTYYVETYLSVLLRPNPFIVIL